MHAKCFAIVVHGFVNATYNVVEGGILDTLFQLNVKGMTAFFDLFVEGTITSEADGSASGYTLLTKIIFELESIHL